MTQVTKTLLELYGFKVSLRFNGEECVEAARLLQPDVIITDIDMPIMDGIAACNMIKKKRENKIPVIALSGNMELFFGKQVDHSFDAWLNKACDY